MVLKESDCNDTAQADGHVQDFANERELLPFVPGKISAGLAKNLKANYRGAASIQQRNQFLSVMRGTA